MCLRVGIHSGFLFTIGALTLVPIFEPISKKHLCTYRFNASLVKNCMCESHIIEALPIGVMIAMQKFEVKSSTHHHHHQFLWPNDVFRVSLYIAMSTLRLLSWVAFVVVGESNCKISFSGVSGEIFGHGRFEILVSPSPTGYML
jgi:hypothetical protein